MGKIPTFSQEWASSTQYLRMRNAKIIQASVDGLNAEMISADYAGIKKVGMQQTVGVPGRVWKGCFLERILVPKG